MTQEGPLGEWNDEQEGIQTGVGVGAQWGQPVIAGQLRREFQAGKCRENV